MMLTQQMNYSNCSIVVRGGRGEDTWAGLVFYIWEFGWDNQMEIVFNKRSDAASSYHT